MKLPKGHLNQLMTGLEGHEMRLRNLRLQIQTLQEEADSHEMVVKIGRNRELIELLKTLITDPGLCERLVRDPKCFLEGHGIKVPEGVTLKAEGGADALSRLEASFEKPTLGYAVGWSQRGGVLCQHTMT